MNPPATHFRALARRTVSLPARVEQKRQAGAWAARLVDLGLGGACIELRESVTEGTLIRLSIDAPHLWDPLELEARVAWARAVENDGASRVGVHFEGVSGTTLRLLAELLEAEAYSA